MQGTLMRVTILKLPLCNAGPFQCRSSSEHESGLREFCFGKAIKFYEYYEFCKFDFHIFSEFYRIKLYE